MNPRTTIAPLAFLLAAGLSAQTTHTLQVGGTDTKGLQGPGNPPPLSAGTDVATAQLTYTFDSATGRLDVLVENTTAQNGSRPNPIINEVHINVPNGAVTGISFVGQSSSGATQPNFNVSIDTDITADPSPNHVGGFGLFNISLTTHVRRGIRNPSATNWSPPTANLVDDATFSFDITGANLNQLSAEDFALSPSYIPPGSCVVTAACKFQAGDDDGSGFIGTRIGCVPTLYMVGEPCIGNTITFILGNKPGCHNCLTYSEDPTPFFLPGSGLTLPASPPFYILFSEDALASLTEIDVTIPNDPIFVGIEVVIVNASWTGLNFEISEEIRFTICTN